MAKKILLGAEYSILDPLALFYLSSVAKEEGFDTKIVLSRSPDYPEFETAIKEFQPDFFGVTIYTGNHVNIGKYFNKIKKINPQIKTISGGPHPTYFPREAARYSDFTVMGEGFDSLRKILRGDCDEGPVYLEKTERFPFSDRETFYRESLEHGQNPIKNVITSTGCSFNCSHCYNSNDISEIEGLDSKQVQNMKLALSSKRFFPHVIREVDEVIEEISQIQRIAPSTKMLFLEDDVFGGNIEWFEEFADKYKARLPFHANMRFELIDPDKKKGSERIRLLKKSGCTGLSLAIESGSEIIRRDVLNRRTSEELMFRVFEALGREKFNVRTYQMLGLPYGATEEKTDINLEADLKTLELNVRLRERTGLPTIAWASTFTPYPGTKIANYCLEKGFTDENSGQIVGDETYRILSVLNHLKEWSGNSISEDSWLDKKTQEQYRVQINELMSFFPIFGLIPDGHEVALDFLTSDKKISIYDLVKKHNICKKIKNGELLEKKLESEDKFSNFRINEIIRHHIYDHQLFGVK